MAVNFNVVGVSHLPFLFKKSTVHRQPPIDCFWLIVSCLPQKAQSNTQRSAKGILSLRSFAFPGVLCGSYRF